MSEFYILERDWNKIQQYSRYAYDEHKSEIGGMMIAVKDNEENWKIFSPVILKQKISSGNTVLDQEALSIYYVKEAMKHKDKEIQFVWWHSHHNMNAFWSPTDLTAINEFNEGNMSLSLVVNLKEEYLLRVNIWKPFPIYQDVDLEIRKAKRNIPKKIVKEIEELCEEPLYNYSRYNFTSHISKVHKSNVTQLSMPLVTNSPAIHLRNQHSDPEWDSLVDKVDEYLQDYKFNVTNFRTYTFKIESLNKLLEEHKSQLRIGMIDDEDELRLVAHNLQADHLIYVHELGWSIDEILTDWCSTQYDSPYNEEERI